MESMGFENMYPENLSDLVADRWNYSQHQTALEQIKMDSNFAWLMGSLVSAIAWIIYITYYNSRISGYFMTNLLNRFVIHTGFFKIGSFTLNVLSGKIMFRDVIYITEDYSLRIQDGYLIFRWWRSYVPKDVSEDLSHSDTRLSVVLNGFELHVYNRSDMYGHLEKLFGLEPNLLPNDKNQGDPDASLNYENLQDTMESENLTVKHQRSEAAMARTWRDLIPVIKMDVCSGRLVFGNRLVPTTLSINVEEAHFVYSTKPAASSLDHFMHFAKCKAENFKVILAPSPKYTGMVDDPPRYMGEGFVIMSSNNVELYTYMDEPGIVPEEPVLLRLANGDVVESAPPVWGIDIKCGKGTDFSYGPWADRQRDNLFKFFFPPDWQPLKVTKAPKPGDRRQMQSFDIRLSTLNEATIDILFSKNKETNAVHVNIGAGSYLEVTLPWIVLQDGYTTKITGQLLHLDATTSLQYRSLVESETLEYTVKCHYPIRWNDHQEWVLNLTGCKATANLVYSHKDFFQDLINDWASKARPDLLHFVPYTWKINLLLKEFEIITISNEYNWVDCSSHNKENCHLAFCGDLFDLSFDLPFVDFLPSTIPLRFWIQGESVDLSMFIPEVYTTRNIVLSLDKNAKVLARDGSIRQRNENIKKWRNVCQKDRGWIDCWSVPIVALSINYTYHPCPPLGPVPQADISTPDKEELLLSPIRFPHNRKVPPPQNIHHWQQDSSKKFDPTSLPADQVSLELEIGPSVMFVYGTVLRNFMHLKENIFGEDQSFTDMQQSRSSETSVQSAGTQDSSMDERDSVKVPFDPRFYRPLEVNVSVTMHDIQAHLVKNCNEADPACPVVVLERFGFELKKNYRQTELQVLLSPSILLTADNVVRPGKDLHLNQGHLMLSALQIRGHAMFSDESRSLDEDTLEYAWLLEIQLGKLSGKITTPQLYHVVTSLETLALLAVNAENTLRPPRPARLCLHGIPPAQCPDSDSDTRYRCPSAEDIKYRMTRVAVDAVDITLVENGTALQTWISPIRFSVCNLHGQQIKSGITCILPLICIRQYILAAGHYQGGGGGHSNTNTTSSSKSNHTTYRDRGYTDTSDHWLEVGSVNLGPIIVESALSLSTFEHNLHLVQSRHLRIHDEKTKRLWFLWPNDPTITKAPGRCGCNGGCAFFGSNRNGPKFFKPSKSDIQDGVNIAAFRIQEVGKDPGFGQSILHEGQLVFHTPPYSLQDVSLQEPTSYLKPIYHQEGTAESPRVRTSASTMERDIPSRASGRESVDIGLARLAGTSASPLSFTGETRSSGRRFSYTTVTRPAQSAVVSALRDVPYARLVDSSPTSGAHQLPHKLDSDSKLNSSERSKSILNVPEVDFGPKNSASDSKLAVDYFYTPPNEPESLSVKPLSGEEISMQNDVNISESHHSLYVRADSEEQLRQEVQRTISMSSENHSEAFFSADEDLNSASRASSLRRSMIGSGSVLNRQESHSQKKKFASDLSIVADSKKAQAKMQSTVDGDSVKVSGRECGTPRAGRLSAHRSDHDIHTPEHRTGSRRPSGVTSSIQQLGSASPRLFANGENLHNVYENQNQDIDSSDTPSISSTSFMSAVSSQEDMTLVNLHMQVNKPIVDSPLLMSSYVGHLSHSRCLNWQHTALPPGSDMFTVPLFQRTDDGRLVYIGGRYLPKFETISEGFTSLKMVNRGDGNFPTSPQTDSRTPTHPYTWDSNQMFTDADFETDHETGVSVDDELLSTTPQSGTRTTVVVKLKGDLDVMVTPLILESLQRFIDALTPTLQKLHPLTVVNHVHAGCIGTVQDANILKQDQSLSYWSQIQSSSNSRSNTAERRIAGHLQTSVYEESLKSELQGTVIVPKVNITVLQASVVEEIISFSALDNIKDLTCVSLFAVCFENITARFHHGKQVKEIVQTFHHPSILPVAAKKTTIANLMAGANKIAASGSHRTGAGNTGMGKDPASVRASSGSRASNTGSTKVSHGDALGFMNRGNTMAVKPEATTSTRHDGTGSAISEGSVDAEGTAGGGDLERMNSGNGGAAGSKISASSSVGSSRTSAIANAGSKTPLSSRANGNTAPTTIGTTKPQSVAAAAMAGLGSNAHISKGKALLAAVVSRTGLRGAKHDTLGSEPVFIETQERQQEETVVTLTVGKVHAQLRRLRNESTILKDAVITAIPTQNSKVLFTCTKVPSPHRTVDYYAQPVQHENTKHSLSQQHSVEEPTSGNGDSKLGFIMFESGLEGVSVKIVKHSQYHKDEEEEHTTIKTETETHAAGTSDPAKQHEDVDKIQQESVSGQRANKPSVKNTPSMDSSTTVKSPIVEGTDSDCSTLKDAGTNTETTTITGQTTVAVKEKGNENTSSCVIDVRTVWFNFAAPPHAPITRKLDYTRLDWNLLSTASPAINAWLSPSNRFAIRVVHMHRSYYRRTTGVIACLMAEALDVQAIHMPIKSRYGRLTPLAKTLQEDPSCQLSSVLQKYMLQSDLSVIEHNLREADMPNLSTLRQGVIVLSRQWKSVLYTPLLLEHNYKTKFAKPLNVTFAVPELDEIGLTDGENSAEDTEPIDECAVLLAPQNGDGQPRLIPVRLEEQAVPGPPVNSPRAINTPVTIVAGGIESVLTSPSPPSVPLRHKRNKSLQPTQLPSSSRASIVFPLLSGSIPFSQRRHDEEIGYGTLKEEKLTSSNLEHLGSNPSLYSIPGPTSQTGSLPSEHVAAVGSPRSSGGHAISSSTGKASLHRNAKHGSAEDLYSWMAKQQDYIRDKLRRDNHSKKEKVDPLVTVHPTNVGNAPLTATTNGAGQYSLLYPLHDSLRLLDAHIIFQPLLSSLGVIPQQMVSSASISNNTAVSSLDSLGSNLSLVGGMETMRIDIVVSQEHGTNRRPRQSQGKSKQNAGTKFHLDIPNETPAFLCEKIGLEMELNKMADMAVDDMIQRQNVLYISRGQLKKHTSTVLNVSLNIRYISQQVNMPLLRLLHQITNMYQNVKETQLELREQQPETKVDVNEHIINKNDSSSTSDLQEHTLVENKLTLKVSDPISIISQSRPTISPSPSVRSRPQSFAQKLRGKSIKGYMNLSDGGASPILPNSPSGSAIDRMTISSDKDTTLFNLTPKCWKTVYYLLDLYATMPETKTIAHRFSVAPDISEHYKGNRKYDLLTEVKSTENIEKGEPLQKPPTPALTARELNVVAGERTRLVVLGVVRIHRTRLLATLSGLKLEAEITALHSSLTCRKKLRPASLECSLTGQVGRTMIVLLEGVPPNQQTVVKVTVGKSQALYSTITKRGKDKNSGLLTVGAINIDIPQHPVALHDMMTRGSKQLSSTLQELRVTRTSSRMSRTGALPDEESPHHQWRAAPPERPVHATAHSNIDGATTGSRTLLQPLVMQFSVVLQSLSITAALLPSLRAQYKMDQVNSTGVTGSKAKFTIDLPHHSLSFTTKLQATEANLPSEASIELPKVHVSAEYVQDGGTNQSTLGGMLFEGGKFSDGVVLRRGSYMSATADIGVFEHSLTTDLLNHLVFVQKVFMKEVNEVVQKVYGAEKPVPIWLDDSTTSVTSSTSRILFSLMIRIKRIQLTATTPTNSAVRLETGAVELELSNRVQNVSGAGVSALHSDCGGAVKLFGRAKVDVNLSLGQLIRNVMFEEAEPEFQQFAFFNTRIELRNAFQDEMVEGNDKEVVLITLKRPLIYIQPMAVDKAILVWLNYKNAYEYWTEKRANLNKEVLTATQQVFEKVPFGQLTSQLSAPHTGTLFLQLTVEDMGICLPLNPLPLNSWGQRGMFDSESRAAVVVTLERTSISACSSGSLVSKAGFVGLCLRFADDFETSLDEWKPDMSDAAIMNYCVVSEGTYEVCSRTIAAKQGLENAKWFLNVQWKMEGVDIHLDVNVGKQLSALGHTLTMLTGAEEDEQIHLDYDSDDADQVDGIKTSQESILVRTNKKWTDSLPAFIFDPSLDAKERSKLIEKEMNEQAKIINDLRSLGASHGTIQQEMKRLHELEAMVFKDFRRDMIQKLRRQSSKTSTLKGKMGLGGPKSSTYRSRSFIVPSPTPEHHLESPVELSTIPGSTPVNTHSFDSSPRSGPSRSASLKVRSQTLASPTSSGSQPKVTFGDAHAMCRQSSLPSAGSELSLPEGDLTWIDHIDIDGEKVEIRRKSPSYESSYEDNFDGSAPLLESFAREQSVSYAPPLPTSQQQKTQEPNIDFELDVKVLINSGKCVLHTKDTVKEEEIKISTRMRKERSSSSAGMTDWSSPASPNLNRTTAFTGGKIGSNEKSNQTSSMPQQHWSGGSGAGRHGGGSYGSTTCCPLTVFHIPAMDIRVHYTSSTTQPSERNDPETSPRYMSDHSFSASQTMPSRKTAGIKKASLFAWMTLQSVPEETIVSPHILEFLEQTLEPIPSKTSFSFPGASTGAADNETTYGNYVYASFPVDVIVYFHMQPSTFRFSCLPVSRVECMLQLPSLDIVFSSKRAEEDLSTIKDGKPNTAATAIGGLSVTGCLADFSVYIFHPYGGGKKSSLKESQWSPLSDSERKDSLSINVEFVKFHLSRSRKLNFHSDMATKMGKQLPDHSRACIRFSTIVTIGSASFKYDMRRLTEILAFPRAWYRRSIMRRLFLGDLSLSTSTQNDNTPTFQQHSDEHGSRYSTDAEHNPMSARDKLKLNLESDVARHARLREIGKNWSMESDETETPSPNETTTTTAWETLVLFAVNFTRLNVHMNMGNVMGNVTWQTKDFRSDGRLSIGSTGHKNLFIGLGLGGSSLDAKGGIVGGTIEIANIDTYIHIREEPFQEPDHTVGLRLLALELRLDYMGTSVLMARVSALDVTLRDEWKLARANSAADTAMFMPTRRPAVIFMHGDLGWDQLQLMISKSTTADLLKMFNKLDEFFSQQFKSSKRVFSSLQPRPTQPSVNLKRRLQTQQTLRGRKGPPNSSVQQTTADSRDTWNTQMQQSVLQDAKHHRHWQNVLACAAKLHLPTLKIPLPSSGTVLGGTMELHGKNISLACFHGINFKSKSWALFSLKEPCISFATEAQEIPSTAATDQLDVHIVQTLTFSLGVNVDKQTAHHESMATVCRMSRNIIFPPQFKTLQEWFHYAFANSEIDAVDRFPSLEREKLENSGTNSIERSRSSSGSSKLQDPNHTREVIFALPCLQLHLKTEHLQTATTPDVMGDKPVVDCSFVTEFEDHIFVTVDAEAFFFLHDLITSYVKEKERVGTISSQSGLRSQSPDPRSSSSVGQNSSSHSKAGSSGTGSSAHSEDDKKNKDFSPGEVFDKDWRRYHCKTWHLEPTVRLLSWAGKSIEPYGIDYILQKLGFSHARTTIPKWMQRGFMDPLDKLLALLMLRMISNKRQLE